MIFSRSLALGCALFVALTFSVQPAWSVTPDSPEVLELVDKALGFLAKSTHDRIGGRCLIALAFKKNKKDATFPKIKEAIDACHAAKFASFSDADNYDLPLMIIFLCEMEDERHRPLVQNMLRVLLSRQKPHGAWGYEANPAGDTSQTQYAVLAMWIADRHKYDVPLSSLSAVLNWFLRTQDTVGGWGYQAYDPGPGAPRSNQSPLTMSLGGAALGSVYMLCDLLTLPGDPFGKPHDPKAVSKLPPAMQEVIVKNAAQAAVRRRAVNNVNPDVVKRSMQDGNRFMDKAFTLADSEWKFYACYAWERYASFREAIEQRPDPEPKWYNDMYADFKAHIRADGSWEGGDTPAVATAFAVLVLSRSTQKVINRAAALGEGILLGGMGLPTNTKDLTERNGKIVEAPVGGGSVDTLLNLLNDQNNPELARLVESDQVIPLDGDITRRTGQITKLRGMVSAPSYETRLVAVRSLARDRNLDNVPVLLFALADEDFRVVREADKGLRFISRKFDGVMPFETFDDATRKSLRKAWREWFLAIKPDAELLD